MAKAIMVQGTMSNAGKSLLAAGLCRIFRQDGYRVAPFKSQNMALNSFITEEGLEMGRAQVMQAEAAGIKPSVLMNPILLKPTNDVGSQVIVNGEVLGTMSARDYFKYKKKLVPDIMKAYDKLASENDIIVIEGAGSPAEINLKTEDIVNNIGRIRGEHRRSLFSPGAPHFPLINFFSVKQYFTNIHMSCVCSASAQGERSSSSRHCAATLPSSTFVD